MTNVTFVLVRPRYPGNIGSAARAIKNMGFKSLRLVRPTVLPTHPDSVRLAVGAADLLKRARVYDDLKEALGDQDLVVATTARVGKRRPDFLSLTDLPAHLPAKVRVAILFGPEERGLTNRELSLAQLVVTIPANPKFSSINLAQSVMLTAYRLATVAQRAKGKAVELREGATVGELEGFYQHLEQVLERVGFFPHENPFRIMRALRVLLNRAGPTRREVRTLRGICRQIIWKMKQPPDLPLR